MSTGRPEPNSTASDRKSVWLGFDRSGWADNIQIVEARHLRHGAGRRIGNVKRAFGVMWNAEAPCDDLELVEYDRGLLDACIVLGGHDDSSGLGGYHRI